LLPARVGLEAPAFEYSIRDFFESQKVGGVCIADVPVSAWSFVASLCSTSVEITFLVRFTYAFDVSASFGGVKVI